ncbi:MAG TPA: precorrin-4 C(11)-methyltransferase, partial [Desulfobacteraceae bacterium]|nr:precorrin-4 C(11)-methyltransferase [Desulfobacteraceae bacterium]
PIIFAGAGPGDPELMTIKAMKALENADLIIYAGSLVPEAVLCWKGAHTQTVSSAGMNLDEMVAQMKAGYLAGKKVVRLHTGDPALYGAIFEQIRELQQDNIPYAVIPGVTAAFAAAASIGMEYTLPEVTQTLILTRMAGRTPVPEAEALEKLAAHGASMAIYLSIGLVTQVQEILAAHYGNASVCAVAYKVSHPEENIIYTTVENLARTCRDNGITRHALIIVGKAVEASRNSAELIKSKLYDATFSHGYRKGE